MATPSVGAQVRAMARPAIAQSLLQTLTFLVDRAMLGRHGAESLAALQVGEAATWCLFLVTSGFTAGTIAVVGRAVGGDDRALRRAAIRATIGLALVAGLAAAALGALIAAAAPALFPEAGGNVIAGARGYLGVALPGYPLLLGAMGLAAVFHASGDTRTPFLAAALGNVLNATGDWLSIFGRFGLPELGPTGAAVGSVASWAAQVAVLGLALAAREGASLRRRGGEIAAARRMLRVAGPAFGERSVQASAYLAFTVMIAALGPTTMAAHQAILGVEAIAFLSADGFGVAGAAVIAQRLGANASSEAREAGWVAARLSVGLLAACGLVFLLFPEALLRVFTDDESLLAIGAPSLRVAAIAQPAMALAVVLGDGLRGAGATRTVFGIAVLGGFVTRLSVTGIAAFGLGWGLVGVWAGSTVDWWLRASLLTRRFRSDAWTRTRV